MTKQDEDRIRELIKKLKEDQTESEIEKKRLKQQIEDERKKNIMPGELEQKLKTADPKPQSYAFEDRHRIPAGTANPVEPNLDHILKLMHTPGVTFKIVEPTQVKLEPVFEITGLECPRGVAVSNWGTVYVLDGDKIKCLNLEGKVIHQGGGFLSGSLNSPSDIKAINGKVYVCEWIFPRGTKGGRINGKIKVFDENCRFKFEFGDGATRIMGTDYQGLIYAQGSEQNSIDVFCNDGRKLNNLRVPYYPNNFSVYTKIVMEEDHNTLDVFELNGNHAHRFNTPMESRQSFLSMAICPNFIYTHGRLNPLANEDNSTIRIFNFNGKMLGEYLFGKGELNSDGLNGICYNNDYIYAADPGNKKIRIFKINAK